MAQVGHPTWLGDPFERQLRGYNLTRMRSGKGFDLKLVDGAPYVEDVKRLIQEYTEWFGRDLSFQALDDELGHIEEKYLPPEGRLVVALEDSGAVCGCVAYHRLDDSTAEMKRLYVTPAGRGHHLGEQLARRIMELARKDGYTRMVLDTVAPLKAAISLYRKLGFEQIESYYHNPFGDVIYFGIDL